MAASSANAALQVINVGDCRVESDADRLQWVAADPMVVGTQCAECDGTWPKYIETSVFTTNSWMRWLWPDVVFRGLIAPSVGCLKGITLDKRMSPGTGLLIRSESDSDSNGGICMESAQQLSFTKVTDGCPVADDEPHASRAAVLQTESTWQCGPASAGSQATCLEWPKEDFVDDGQAMTFKCHTGFSTDTWPQSAARDNSGFTRTCTGGVLGAVSATCVPVATSGQNLVDFCDDVSRAAWCSSRTDEF